MLRGKTRRARRAVRPTQNGVMNTIGPRGRRTGSGYGRTRRIRRIGPHRHTFRGAPTVSDDPTVGPGRADLIQKLYDRLIGDISRLHDREPDIQRWQREIWARRCGELRTLSPWYAMQAERARRKAFADKRGYDRYWYRQRVWRERNRRRVAAINRERGI